MKDIPHAFVRYYTVPPHKKSLEQCESHGSDHAAYRWSMQIDPGWSEEQREAYLRGYNKGKETDK
jgi:hypothetical protein